MYTSLVSNLRFPIQDPLTFYQSFLRRKSLRGNELWQVGLPDRRAGVKPYSGFPARLSGSAYADPRAWALAE